MNNTANSILTIIEQYLKANPSIRFTQALFNLGITEFADKTHPEPRAFLLRDMYNDSDAEVILRICNPNRKQQSNDNH